jgi:hypothetical protein
MTPFDWFSLSLRFWAGAVGVAWGVVSPGAGPGDWASVTPAAKRQSRDPMIRMALKRVDVRTVPSGWVAKVVLKGTRRASGEIREAERTRVERIHASRGFPFTYEGPRPFAARRKAINSSTAPGQ